jgi:hypothetical protein
MRDDTFSLDSRSGSSRAASASKKKRMSSGTKSD